MHQMATQWAERTSPMPCKWKTNSQSTICTFCKEKPIHYADLCSGLCTRAMKCEENFQHQSRTALWTIAIIKPTIKAKCIHWTRKELISSEMSTLMHQTLLLLFLTDTIYVVFGAISESLCTNCSTVLDLKSLKTDVANMMANIIVMNSKLDKQAKCQEELMQLGKRIQDHDDRLKSHDQLNCKEHMPSQGKEQLCLNSRRLLSLNFQPSEEVNWGNSSKQGVIHPDKRVLRQFENVRWTVSNTAERICGGIMFQEEGPTE